MLSEFWTAATPHLDAKLDRANVRKPSRGSGVKGDYIEGWHAIAEANRVFGFGGWSYEIDMRKESLCEVKKDDGPQWQAAYTCICTVNVEGVIRQAVGFGSGFAKQIGSAIEGATKEAETDALKRALRTFGNIFGLALYDKTQENVGDPEFEYFTATLPDIHDADAINALIPRAKKAGEIYSRMLYHRAQELGFTFDKGIGVFHKPNELPIDPTDPPF